MNNFKKKSYSTFVKVSICEISTINIDFFKLVGKTTYYRVYGSFKLNNNEIHFDKYFPFNSNFVIKIVEELTTIKTNHQHTNHP